MLALELVCAVPGTPPPTSVHAAYTSCQVEVDAVCISLMVGVCDTLRPASASSSFHRFLRLLSAATAPPAAAAAESHCCSNQLALGSGFNWIFSCERSF